VDVWDLIRFAHVVALAFFVGGQIMLVVAVAPALRDRESGARHPAMRSVARRFGAATGVALVVLVATGVAMASEFARWEDDVLQLKLLALVLAGVLIGMHAAAPDSRALAAAVLVSSLAVVWLGVELTH
jgi:uncharacterized membrane protein